MSCRRINFPGGAAYLCGPAVYRIRLRGRDYFCEAPTGIGGPAFITEGGEPWKRQPYNGELWAIGERMIWGLAVPTTAAWYEGEERTDADTGARVERIA